MSAAADEAEEPRLNACSALPDSAALEEVWQLHTDGLLLQAAELLAEVEAVERAAAEPPPAGVAAARRTLEGHRVSRRGGSNSGLADGRHVRYSGMRAPHRRRTR